MKFLTLIFAIYVLLLPCIPCMDAEECSDISITEISQPTGHENHEGEDEACNPFCSCACCSHNFIPDFQLNKMTKDAVVQGQQYRYNNISLSSDFFGNIWQPPKFS